MELAESGGALYWKWFGSDEHVVTLSAILELDPPPEPDAFGSHPPQPFWAPMRERDPAGLGLRGLVIGEGRQRVGWLPLWWLLSAAALLPVSRVACAVAFAVVASKSRRQRGRGARGAVNVPTRRRTPWRIRCAFWLTAASAAACVTTAFFWEQSITWHEYLVGWSGGHSASLASPRRECAFSFDYSTAADSPGRMLAVDEYWLSPQRPERLEKAGPPHAFPWFRYEPVWGQPTLFGPKVQIGHGVTVPHWFLFLLTALLPAWGPIARARAAMRSRRRRRRGLCIACGYDLRAIPAGGGAILDRCPECGLSPNAGRARTVGPYAPPTPIRKNSMPESHPAPASRLIIPPP